MGKETVVQVEQRPPLAVRIAGIAVVVVLLGVLLVWGVDLGRRIVGASQGETLPDVQQQLTDAQAEIARLTAERDALQARLTAAGLSPAAPAAGSAPASAPAPAGSAAASAAPAASAPAGGPVPAASVPPVTAGASASGIITPAPQH